MYMLFSRNIDQLCPENIFGFLINVPSRFSLSALPLPLPGKHWIAVRRIGDTYFDLDSKLAAPRAICNDHSKILAYLRAKMAADEHKTELLVIVTGQVAGAGLWEHKQIESNTDLADSGLTDQIPTSDHVAR
jgi:josephin